MKHLIYKYLSTYYRIDDGILISIKTELSKSKIGLVLELEKIFDLSEKKLKWYIKGWCRKQDRNFNFNNYWNRLGVFNLPHISRVYSTLIADSLISVQPMEAPVGILHYMDTRIGESAMTRTDTGGPRWEHNTYSRPVNAAYYGRIHVPGIFENIR